MTAKKPHKFFPGFTAQIHFRKVDKWAEANKHWKPYFDTWQEAHRHMLDRAEKEVKQLASRLKSAERHLAKVRVMQEPEQKEPTT